MAGALDRGFDSLAKGLLDTALVGVARAGSGRWASRSFRAIPAGVSSGGYKVLVKVQADHHDTYSLASG